MMKKTIWKRVALTGLLLLLLLGISGCFTKPDKIDATPTDPVQEVLPFQTVTPTPSPAPTDGGQGTWEEWVTSDPNITGPTQAPVVATQTIAVISATPVPQWTYSPPPVTATPDSTLRNGSSGQAVRNLQQRLKDLGYYSGSVDGDFGSGTESALKEFQRANGLTADGVAGSRTLSAINSSSAKSKPKQTATKAPTANAARATSRPTPKSYTPSTLSTYRYLQVGGSGSDVTRLQNRLKELGYFKGTVSGNFGTDTEAAVKAFQERNGLWVDGVAGEDTQRMLFSNAALPASSGSRAIPSSGGYRALEANAEGDDVTQLQKRLAEMGYFTDKVDGKYGQSTAAAVKLFQETNGMTGDGVAGSGTLARLYSTLALYAPVEEIQAVSKAAVETLEKGATGEAVYALQERLYNLGYYGGRIDGVYSDDVVSAIKAFQRANKLSADGKAGRNTQVKLFADSAIASEKAPDDVYTTLRQGDEGERVLALQSLLNTYGYYIVTPSSGKYDTDTVSAVQTLQRQSGLPADGVAGPATLQLLYDGSPSYMTAEMVEAAQQQQAQAAPNYTILQQGSSGPDVTMLQQFLLELGYLVEDEDGTFGPSTMLALQDFQERNSMTPDGVAGQETLALLYSGLGEPADMFGVVIAETPQRDTMREGDEGQDVFTMQERLFVLGYLPVEPDGIYGRTTTDAVRAFQSRNDLSSDGVAGKTTVEAMYASNVKVAVSVAAAVQEYISVDNRTRELEEQQGSGAIQASLAGGGIAASQGSTVYYTGKDGTLYRKTSSNSSGKQIYDGKASYIHAADKGITFVSGNKILRVPAGGGKAETLATGKDVKKLSVVGDTLYYLDGDKLERQSAKVDAQEIASNVTDFTVDVFQNTAYTAGPDGIWCVGLNGNAPERLVSSAAEQVQVVDSVVFYRSGGNIYRMQDGVSVLIQDANTSWMGVYRDTLYYISGYTLYSCDTDGTNSQVFATGSISKVSFVAGNVYLVIGGGSAVTNVIPVASE